MTDETHCVAQFFLCGPAYSVQHLLYEQTCLESFYVGPTQWSYHLNPLGKKANRVTKQTKSVWCLTHILELPPHSQQAGSKTFSTPKRIFLYVQKYIINRPFERVSTVFLPHLSIPVFLFSLLSPPSSLLLPHLSVSIWQKPNNYLFLSPALTHSNVMTQTIHSNTQTRAQTGGRVINNISGNNWSFLDCSTVTTTRNMRAVSSLWFSQGVLCMQTEAPTNTIILTHSLTHTHTTGNHCAPLPFIIADMLHQWPAWPKVVVCICDCKCVCPCVRKPQGGTSH